MPQLRRFWHSVPRVSAGIFEVSGRPRTDWTREKLPAAVSMELEIPHRFLQALDRFSNSIDHATFLSSNLVRGNLQRNYSSSTHEEQ